jgi:hypothetical protein
VPYADRARQLTYLRDWQAKRRQQRQSLCTEVAALCGQVDQARTTQQLAVLVRPLTTLLAQLVGRGPLPPPVCERLARLEARVAALEAQLTVGLDRVEGCLAVLDQVADGGERPA